MIETIDPGKAERSLVDALSSTFAEIAFIDVVPIGAGAREPAASAEPVRAAIDMLKPLSCRLELECPASLLRKIEGNLFQGEGAGEDLLLELLNVLAGAFATSCFGAGADVKLELPRYVFSSAEAEGPEGSEGAEIAQVLGDAEGERLLAALRSVRYRY